MADEIDRANDQAQHILDMQLLRRKPTLKPMGRCHFCDDELRFGIFCSGDCRDDYEKEQRAKERNGQSS